jgi:hypothetical protein
MSSGNNLRKAVQLHVCRAILARYLTGDDLEKALQEMKVEMRTGANAWAFKRKDPDDIDDRIYYNSGGNV